MAEVVYNYSKASIPLETMWTDIDYMDLRKVFTLDPDRFPLPKMRELVTYLHDHDQHYVVMGKSPHNLRCTVDLLYILIRFVTGLVDPAVARADYGPYNRGESSGIFLQRNGSDYVGAVWP